MCRLFKTLFRVGQHLPFRDINSKDSVIRNCITSHIVKNPKKRVIHFHYRLSIGNLDFSKHSDEEVRYRPIEV